MNGRSPRTRYLSWAALLWRVFEVDVWRCKRCGGPMKLRGIVDGPVGPISQLRRPPRGHGRTFVGRGRELGGRHVDALVDVAVAHETTMMRSEVIMRTTLDVDTDELDELAAMIRRGETYPDAPAAPRART